MLKRFKQRKKIIFLWTGRVSNTRRILSENGRSEIFSKNGRVGTSAVYLRTILVITCRHKLYQQHSERSSLRSSETKSHRHLNIKALAFLNPCPKFIDVLICIPNKRIPEIPVNTCAEMYPEVLAGTIVAILD